MGANKLFSRAYNKAALIQAGQPSTLSPEEDKELRKYLYSGFPGEVPCQECGSPTLDQDRKKPAICPRGLRICGYCCWWMLKRSQTDAAV
jgi:hypothetical protein